ncbi:hypothetical protein XENORESO_002168 [Xenotaenia resolanae]|uniref:Uncharacterized protein n=1 Tax=Xenotaenia resolanae TaxID=208358 RepID=A0ABV0WCE5_9TELE
MHDLSISELVEDVDLHESQPDGIVDKIKDVEAAIIHSERSKNRNRSGLNASYPFTDQTCDVIQLPTLPVRVHSPTDDKAAGSRFRPVTACLSAVFGKHGVESDQTAAEFFPFSSATTNKMLLEKESNNEHPHGQAIRVFFTLCSIQISCLLLYVIYYLCMW